MTGLRCLAERRARTIARTSPDFFCLLYDADFVRVESDVDPNKKNIPEKMRELRAELTDLRGRLRVSENVALWERRELEMRERRKWENAFGVKGFRTPASQWRDEMLGGRRPKSLRGGNRGEVSAGSGVGLWRFSLCMPRSLDFERGSRPSNHRGVGFGRRVQDRSGGLVVSDLRFGDRRRD